MASQQTIKVSVGYMTSVPAVGHLEFIIHYATPDIPQAQVQQIELPSQDAILTLITPHVLDCLGGNVDEWTINKYDVNEEEYNYTGVTYLYNFEWKNINNKDRSCPIMRTISFRMHRHQFELFI
jgi:hypothetical protein